METVWKMMLVFVLLSAAMLMWFAGIRDWMWKAKGRYWKPLVSFLALSGTFYLLKGWQAGGTEDVSGLLIRPLLFSLAAAVCMIAACEKEMTKQDDAGIAVPAFFAPDFGGCLAVTTLAVFFL